MSYYSLKRGYVPSVSHKALLKKVAVCDGYSHAFQMVMRKLKIPCRFVTGSSGSVGHAWNMVKLSGKWYHIDVTFDRPDYQWHKNASTKNRIIHTFFHHRTRFQKVCIIRFFVGVCAIDNRVVKGHINVIPLTGKFHHIPCMADATA